MKKILVVDDEPSVLRSTQLLLADLGFEVVTTNDASSIHARVAAEAPDLLLQDVRMPGLDLDALLDGLRQDPQTRTVPVLLFSASIDLPVIQERVGAAGYLEKPFRPNQILDAIALLTGP